VSLQLPSSPRRRSWRLRIPILVVLLLGIGGLVAAAVLSVLAIGLGSSTRNTYDLLADKADLVMSSVEQQIRLHLEPPRHQAEFLARMVAARELDLANRSQVAEALYAAQAATPEINSLILVDTAFQAMVVSRGGEVHAHDWTDEDMVRERFEEAGRTKQSYWGDVLWTPGLARPIHGRA